MGTKYCRAFRWRDVYPESLSSDMLLAHFLNFFINYNVPAKTKSPPTSSAEDTRPRWPRRSRDPSPSSNNTYPLPRYMCRFTYALICLPKSMHRNLFGDTPVSFTTAPAASGPSTCTVFLIDRICDSCPPESLARRLRFLRRNELTVLSSLAFDTSESHDLAEPGVRRLFMLLGDRFGVVGAETVWAAREGKVTHCPEGALGVGNGPS